MHKHYGAMKESLLKLRWERGTGVFLGFRTLIFNILGHASPFVAVCLAFALCHTARNCSPRTLANRTQ